MSERTIEWDRQKLYEAVWEKPVVQLAKEYGISDVAIAKVCKKLKIPKPGLGYWRRKELGFKVQRQPLPPTKGVVHAVSHVPIDWPKKGIPEEFTAPLKTVKVVQTRHETVIKTARAFEKGGVDDYGRLRPSDWQLPRFELKVAKTGLQRALAFMDSLVKLVQANGIAVKAIANPREWANRFCFNVDGEDIRILLREPVRRRKRGSFGDRAA